MLRVLMVLEDYGELMFLQTVLKKIGFDVDAIQNPRSFTDSLLTMNPDVLVMTAYGKRIRGFELAKGVKRNRNFPQIILIRTPGVPQDDDAIIGKWLDSPVGALDLLGAMADLCGLNKDVLADKFAKLRIQETTSDEARILRLDEAQTTEGAEMQKAEESSGNFGKIENSTMSNEQRKERYKKFIEEERPEHIGFSVKQVQDQVKSLRREENPEDLAELERQRKAFVEHLFKKKT